MRTSPVYSKIECTPITRELALAGVNGADHCPSMGLVPTADGIAAVAEEKDKPVDISTIDAKTQRCVVLKESIHSLNPVRLQTTFK